MLRLAAKLIVLLFLLWLPDAQAAVAVSSTRVWPAEDYTRLTLESKQPISYNMFTLDNPVRLVVDLDDVDLHGPLDELARKVSNDDPYIKSIRIGQFKPGVVRLVLDLKTEVKPQLFSLKPVAEYGYRLVLDIYPAVPVDPLMALLSKSENEAAPTSSTAATATAESTKATGEAAPALPAEAPPSVPPPAAEIAKPAPEKKPPELRARPIIIAIDAGHGGEDPGAHGRYGTLEKNVTLAIARKLRKLVDASDDMRAVMTRDGDYFIPLHIRVVKARKAHADLFVSIHADAFIKPTASGSSVFALSEHGATSAAARWLAKNENEADLIGGVNIAVDDPYLARTLLDLSQTATITDSLRVGKLVLNRLGAINNLHRGFVEQAGFAVLKAPDIPSILVETAFISNPDEERHLKDEGYQEKVARAIFDGIKRYFARNPPLSRQHLTQND
jgi:N-acetylmuramoyl-L-alanine amidase